MSSSVCHGERVRAEPSVQTQSHLCPTSQLKELCSGKGELMYSINNPEIQLDGSPQEVAAVWRGAIDGIALPFTGHLPAHYLMIFYMGRETF